MGLLKAMPTGMGVDAVYWKVSTTEIDWHKRQAQVRLLGFVSQDARQTGKFPVKQVILTFGGMSPAEAMYDGSFPFTFEGDTVKEAYQRIKTIPGWTDAQDA